MKIKRVNINKLLGKYLKDDPLKVLIHSEDVIKLHPTHVNNPKETRGLVCPEGSTLVEIIRDSKIRKQLIKEEFRYIQNINENIVCYSPEDAVLVYNKLIEIRNKLAEV